VTNFRCTSSFLVLATLAVMNEFLSGYRRKDGDNIKYLCSGFTNIDVDGEERSQFTLYENFGCR